MKSSELILTAKQKLPYAKTFKIDALVLKASLIWMGLNSNVSETLAVFERALEQHNTIQGTKYLNNVLKIKLFLFPSETPGE